MCESSIGREGQPWNQQEKQQWFEQQKFQRSYFKDVVPLLDELDPAFKVVSYGELNYQNLYPLYAVVPSQWNQDKPSVLITGGVHGYETSGVLGAIQFIKIKGPLYLQHFNLVIAPCISPWGYETINRWNPNAVDPNRSFSKSGEADESKLLMEFLDTFEQPFLAHIDLHETTDTDNEIFRPALAARDAKPQKVWNIPDGFYLVGDTEKPVPEFQKAIIDSVEKITHIAPADENDCLIGEALQQKGVINYAKTKLGLCGGYTGAAYVTTTEVYPDSELVDDQNCCDAQVGAIVGGLEFLVGL